MFVYYASPGFNCLSLFSRYSQTKWICMIMNIMHVFIDIALFKTLLWGSTRWETLVTTLQNKLWGKLQGFFKSQFEMNCKVKDLKAGLSPGWMIENTNNMTKTTRRRTGLFVHIQQLNCLQSTVFHIWNEWSSLWGSRL